MNKKIQCISVHLHNEENPHEEWEPMNGYEKGSFYCVLTRKAEAIMYPLHDIWRVKVTYKTSGKEQPNE